MSTSQSVEQRRPGAYPRTDGQREARVRHPRASTARVGALRIPVESGWPRSDGCAAGLSDAYVRLVAARGTNGQLGAPAWPPVACGGDGGQVDAGFGRYSAVSPAPWESAPTAQSPL